MRMASVGLALCVSLGRQRVGDGRGAKFMVGRAYDETGTLDRITGTASTCSVIGSDVS